MPLGFIDSPLDQSTPDTMDPRRVSTTLRFNVSPLNQNSRE